MQFTSFLGEWKPTFKPEKDRLTYYFDRFILSLAIACVTCPVWIGLHFFIFPTNPAYPFSFLPPSYLNTWTYLGFGAYYTLALYGVWTSLMTVGLMGATYAFMIFSVLRKDLMGRTKLGYSTLNTLRTRENLPRVYRELEILHKYLIFSFDHIIIPTQSIATQICLSCNFILITGWADLDLATASILILWSCGGLSVWTAFLLTGSYIFNQGKKITASWKYLDWTRGDKKYMGKFKKGCRPLAIRVGGYFCVRKLSVLKFWQGIVRGTFRALLALKKNWWVF